MLSVLFVLLYCPTGGIFSSYANKRDRQWESSAVQTAQAVLQRLVLSVLHFPKSIFLAQPLLDLSPNRHLHLILPYPAVQPVLCLVLCVCVLHVVLQYHFQQPLGAPDLCRQFLSQIVHMPYVVRVIHNSRCALYFVYEVTPTSYCLCSAAKGVAVCNTPFENITSLVFESTVDVNKSLTPEDIFRAPG